jgi:hypothetical protein
MKRLLFAILLLTVSASAETFTIGAGSYDCASSRISSTATTTNYGTEVYLRIYDDNTATGRFRSLIKWDELKDSLYGVSVTSCSLFVDFYAYGSATLQYGIYGILAYWLEDSVTWNNRRDGVAWTTAGCQSAGNDRTTDIYDTHTGASDTTDDGWYAFDITTLAQTWDGTDTANCQGMLISVVQNTGLYTNFDFTSDDNATTARRPKIKVIYSAATAEGITRTAHSISGAGEAHSIRGAREGHGP